MQAYGDYLRGLGGSVLEHREVHCSLSFTENRLLMRPLLELEPSPVDADTYQGPRTLR